MIDIQPMTNEQTRHLAEAAELWKVYGPLLQQKRLLVGGLQWKTVAGNEYLYRYQPDPITKKKRSTSVGRRSPETEALYQEFVSRRDRVNAELAALEPTLESHRRVSKALRLNRIDTSVANVIETLWEDNLYEHLLAFGETAVGAYEPMFGQVLPFNREAEMAFVIPDDEQFLDSLMSSLRRLDPTFELIGNAITGEAHSRVWVYGRDQVGFVAAQRLHHEDMEVFEELLDQPAEPTVAIARGGSLVPMTAVNPVAYAVWEILSGDDTHRPSTIASLALDQDLAGAGPSDLLEVAARELWNSPPL